MVELAYLAMAIAMGVALVRPIGKDLQVLAFALPWNGFHVEVGVSLVLYQVVIMLLVAKYLFVGQLQLGAIPRLTYLLAAIVVGALAAAFTLLNEEHMAEIVGGEWRNGWRRALVVGVVFSLNLMTIGLVVSARRVIDLLSILRALVLGIVCLTLVGYFQVATWIATGVDPFPIGVLSGIEGVTRSAIFEASHFSFLRMCSLGGEPKTTGVAISIAILVVTSFDKVLIPDYRLRYAVLAGLFFGLFLCMSSSAFATTAVGLPLVYWFKTRKSPVSSRLLTTIPYAFSALVLILQFNYVSNFSLVKDPLAHADVREAGLLGYFKHMTIDRIEVEDFDYLMIQSFMADPLGLLAGRGFGLGHIAANRFVPSELSHYMGNTAISPKSVNVLLLVNMGVIGLAYMLFFLAGQIPAPRGRVAIDADMAEQQKIVNRQALGIAVLVATLLRAEQFATCLFVLGTISALWIVQVTERQPQRRIALRWKSQPLALKR